VDFSSWRLIPILRTKEAKAIRGHTNPEQWFLDQLRAYTLRQPRGARTPDCPDDSFLRAYAAKPTSFPLSDPRIMHVTSCDHCLPGLLEMRSAGTASHSSRVRVAAIATLCAACLVAGFFGATYWNRLHTVANENRSAKQQLPVAIVDRTLDLTDYGTLRGAGEQPSHPPLNLPAALLHVNLILPRFSESGAYTIMVASDRNGKGRLACTTGIAATTGNQTKLAVTLDLRGAKPGDYLLLTELSGQDDFYSYPLRIQ
jgi:hypothetical protein